MANKQQFRNSIKIQQCREDLVKGLDDVTIQNILDRFLCKFFITSEDKNIIEAEKTEQSKARKLLDLIQRKVESQDKVKKSDLFDEFVELLEIHDEGLASTVAKADDSVPNDKRQIDYILENIEGMDLDERMLNRILMYMGPGWESVAAELGINSIKIAIAKENNPYNSRNQMFEVFNFWRQREALGRGGLRKFIKAIDSCSVHCNIDMKKILECIEGP
ncbi:death domain-containing protein CRADD isoform X2 [Octopus bimaculoides]|uniref:Death domain-containing protein n=1 Tax=Octopus bimaculoides TaxID=37653 RepID=A0A0L8HVL9_OCTBM|nr:death domain-containing protein CRADD isoform X2 [Octopus bimaculoides]|eukprot:XP_014769030.1 PREDICTED: death domain-containing protein CRADD-like [Octopus bimaculoides]